jgi:hypothetical protein
LKPFLTHLSTLAQTITNLKIMKKSFLAVALILGASTTFAQEKQYLPESGDWAIGVDATPFLNYFGNFIGGNGLNSAPTWDFPSWNQTITGKYFASEDMAYRAAIRLGFGSDKGSNMIGQDGAAAPTYPNLPTTLEDSYNMGGTAIGLSGGLEMRKGSGRLIGFYGGELGLTFLSSKETYTYGNAMTTTGASTTDFGSNLTTDTYGNPARITESKSGMTSVIGLRGFIGAEYFVLPKLSLGGEFGWGLGMVSNGASSTTMESTNGTAIGSQTIDGTKSSSFAFDTDNSNTVVGASGAIRVTFHF